MLLTTENYSQHSNHLIESKQQPTPLLMIKGEILKYEKRVAEELNLIRCAIWYHLYNLENVKSTHGGVLILIKLQAKACNFTKRNTSSWCLFFINLIAGREFDKRNAY